TRREIGDRDASACTASARFAGNADHAALSLEYEVERGAVAVWAVLAESRDRAIDDARVAFARRFVSESKASERADAIVFQHDVAFFDQAEKQFLAFRALEIDDDPPLVSMQAHEVGGFAARQRDAPAARNVACARRLELDHLRAEIGKHRRAEWPRACGDSG